MTKHVVTIDQDKTAHDAAKIMESNHIGCLVVVKDGNPVGIITERDLVHRVCAKNQRSEDISLNSIISRPLVSVNPESSVLEVAQTMTRNKIRRLLVVKDQKPAGIITATDLAKHLRWGKTPQEMTNDILKAIEREA